MNIDIEIKLLTLQICFYSSPNMQSSGFKKNKTNHRPSHSNKHFTLECKQASAHPVQMKEQQLVWVTFTSETEITL